MRDNGDVSGEARSLPTMAHCSLQDPTVGSFFPGRPGGCLKFAPCEQLNVACATRPSGRQHPSGSSVIAPSLDMRAMRNSPERGGRQHANEGAGGPARGLLCEAIGLATVSGIDECCATGD